MQCQSNEVKQQTNIIRSNASEGRRANDTDVCCNFCMCVIYNSVIQSQYIRKCLRERHKLLNHMCGRLA
jgi:hypothetical protein